ncbi:hypothetical protein AALP_AA1G267600 [Arabis alpina]|uniref:Uncharacterized protein n=1 Tax=Arabis alpina TaxID=50452 RepID=A0A087HQX1_ARAAL|nr:hypothetical protein AALP_AA1G267600 [Arabis alpina]
MKRERKKQKRKEEEEEEEKKMEVAVAVVEQGDDALAAAITVAAAAAAKEEEELWGMRDVLVDELMTWSTVWLPSCWDVEFVGKNYGVLFNDVVWDDDLWNLNATTQLPPLDNNNNIRKD